MRNNKRLSNFRNAYSPKHLDFLEQEGPPHGPKFYIIQTFSTNKMARYFRGSWNIWRRL